MAKLRHVSLHTPDPEKTAEFYKRVFDMVEVGRTDDKFAEGIFLSDGTVNLSVVRFKTEHAADRGDGLGSAFGLHHIGFWVENEDETRRRLKDAGAEYNFTVDRPDFYEEKYKGPDAVMIDISARSWVGAEPPFSVPDSGSEADMKGRL
jgi:catechol 2,3-dioxygenase-like lactoylglutathione lyase family enzyme